MLVAEPIVLFICLYVAVEFGTLFSFFTSVPYVFGETYGFGVEDSGLVFVAILIGCVLGFVTIVLCDVLLYRPQTRRFPEHRVPPEYRLYPAIFASVGLPVGLFWFGWTARSDISWVSPVAAIIPFAWGNLCLFVTTIQYITDTYTGNVVASAASANSFARYTFGAVFPLFTIQSKSLSVNGSVHGFPDTAYSVRAVGYRLGKQPVGFYCGGLAAHPLDPVQVRPEDQGKEQVRDISVRRSHRLSRSI